jgi:formylglycine-generating enzyme required for sulfatase activity
MERSSVTQASRPANRIGTVKWASSLAGVALLLAGSAAAATATKTPPAPESSNSSRGAISGAPVMVSIRPGDFTMGAAGQEPGHAVHIGYSFAVSAYPVTVAEFAAFVSDSGYDSGSECSTHVGAAHGTLTKHTWRDPGFTQEENSPVVCVSWNDAQAYITWLSKRTGGKFRLLTEAEYEYVNRAGTTTAYWWGDTVGSGHANCDGCGSTWDAKRSSPVGSFAPNAFGLYDTTGNVWEWLADCWGNTYAGAPSDGSAATGADCVRRSIRGGSWGHDPATALTRHGLEPGTRDFYLGFRVARTL